MVCKYYNVLYLIEKLYPVCVLFYDFLEVYFLQIKRKEVKPKINSIFCKIIIDNESQGPQQLDTLGAKAPAPFRDLVTSSTYTFR